MTDASETSFQVVRAAGLAVAIAIGLAVERCRPHADLRPALSTNVGLWVVDTIVMGVACGACAWTAATWAASNGVGLLVWMNAGTVPAVLAGLFGLDAVSYAWHRANHRVPFLWRFHQVHHGDASFHVTTALRFHPGELVLALPVRLAAVVLLGVPPLGVLLFELVFGTANLLEHGNFDLPRRLEPWLRRAVVTPTLHRGHHEASWRELDTNFGTIFSIWDRVGRTYRACDARRVVTGLPDRSGLAPPALAESLWLPFARRRERAR